MFKEQAPQLLKKTGVLWQAHSLYATPRVEPGRPTVRIKGFLSFSPPQDASNKVIVASAALLTNWSCLIINVSNLF
jgi:hypothetical protein